MIAIDGDVLHEIAPRFRGSRAERQASIIEAVSGALRSTLAEYEIDTRLRAAHFLAQICHESDGLCTTEEYASGEAYEGREDLGNTKSGDGRRFKGRGLIQLTGRANYQTYGDALDLNLVSEPELAAEPQTSLRIACEYWRRRHINERCDRDDILAVTRAVNGGLNGLEGRRVYLATAKAALARLDAVRVTANTSADLSTSSPLRRGSRNEQVADLQDKLRKRGYAVAIDGVFGPGTEVAVMHFQASHGLQADGIVGPETWAKL